MKFSLTSTSTSSESMSTMVPMPVRVKPPPAETGETISPSCAALTVTMPPNGARTTVSSRLRCVTARLGLGDTQRAARDVEIRLRGVVARLGVVERLRADERGRELRAVALVHRARVVERDLRRRKVRALLLDLRRRLRDLRPHVRVVEARDDLARFDSLPFLDEHGRDLARDLGRHRGLAPRDDVAGRVEYRSNGRRRRRKARGGSDFRCGGDARLQLLRRHGDEPHGGENGDGKADRAGARPSATCAAPRAAQRRAPRGRAAVG